MVNRKSALRKIYLEKMRALSPAERDELSKKIADSFFDNIPLVNVRALHIFLPISRNNEIDTRYIYERIWHEHPAIRTLVPRVDFKKDELESLELTPTTKLTRNDWGIEEPAGGDVVSPAEVDLVVAPLLCFDLKGYRVGYGKGYYDRFLARCKQDVQKAGVSYFRPVEDIDDVGRHDQRLDSCITPDGVILFD